MRRKRKAIEAEQIAAGILDDASRHIWRWYEDSLVCVRCGTRVKSASEQEFDSECNFTEPIMTVRCTPWRYDPKACPKSNCCDCRAYYSSYVDIRIPEKIWRLISPTITGTYGTVCPNCIFQRLKLINKLGQIARIEFVYEGKDEEDKGLHTDSDKET